jgi:hypothetical protein
MVGLSQVTFKEWYNEIRARSPWSMTFTCSLTRIRRDSCTGTILKWWQRDSNPEQELNLILETYTDQGVYTNRACFQEFVTRTRCNLMVIRAQVAIISILIWLVKAYRTRRQPQIQLYQASQMKILRMVTEELAGTLMARWLTVLTFSKQIKWTVLILKIFAKISSITLYRSSMKSRKQTRQFS